MPDSTRSSLQDIQVFSVDDLSIRVANSSSQLTQDAASLAQKYLESKLTQQETVSIILATDNSQLAFLNAIASSNKLDWSRIILFHLDEYLGISANHPGSFRYYLRSKVEQRVQPLVFNYIEGDAVQPLTECDRYSKLLQQQVNSGYFSNLEAVPTHAYTLTIPTICTAQKIFCLAGGSNKAGVVKKMLTGDISPRFPVSIILRIKSQATLFCDRKSWIKCDYPQGILRD